MSFVDKRVYKAFRSSKEYSEGLAKYLDNKLQDNDWSNQVHIPDGISLHIKPPIDI